MKISNVNKKFEQKNSNKKTVEKETKKTKTKKKTRTNHAKWAAAHLGLPAGDALYASLAGYL